MSVHILLLCNNNIIAILIMSSKQIKYPCKRPWRPIGLWDCEDPTLSRQPTYRRRLWCQPYARAALHPPWKIPGTHSVRDWTYPNAIVHEGLGKSKKSNGLIGNRTQDLPAFSIVSQPITLPRIKSELSTRGEESKIHSQLLKSPVPRQRTSFFLSLFIKNSNLVLH
jgi:hypothetical protein